MEPAFSKSVPYNPESSNIIARAARANVVADAALAANDAQFKDAFRFGALVFFVMVAAASAAIALADKLL